MPRRRTRLHYALFALLLLPVIARAQSTFGDIRGTTRDPQGLALPNATVTLNNTGENTTRSAITDNNGNFLFENLKPGTYALTATKAGFSGSPTATIELADRYRRCDRRRHQGNESVGPNAAQFSRANHQPPRRPGIVTERDHR
jgi:hypothetical protein